MMQGRCSAEEYSDDSWGLFCRGRASFEFSQGTGKSETNMIDIEKERHYVPDCPLRSGRMYGMLNRCGRLDRWIRCFEGQRKIL